MRTPEQWKRIVLGVGPAALLVVLGLWEACAIVRSDSDLPGRGDWARASEALRADWQSGDLIVFAPAWLSPVGRQQVGDLIPVEMAFRMDAGRYRRIWELSARGERASETRGLQAAWSHQFGGLRLRRYEQEPAQLVTDLVTAPRRGPARVLYHEVGYQPHKCLLVVPSSGQASVTFSGIALGSQLVGYVGIADVFTRRADRAVATLEVVIDGTSVVAARAGVEHGWVRFSADTQPSQSAEVVVTVGSESRARQICFAAEARR